MAALYCSALRTWPKSESVWKRSSIVATAHFRAFAAFFGSVMMGVARCGRFSYISSSTILGSMRISFTWSGRAL